MSKATTSVVTAPRSVDFSLSLIGIGFFASGFCSLLYQIIWTRLAFAAFGIITPVLSVVVSVFMLGLGIGSIWGGRWAAAAARRGISPLIFWAGAEALTAIGAFLVPVLFKAGQDFLLRLQSAASATYLLISALVMTAAMLPWCIAMGTTVPVVMAQLRRRATDQSFSLLYLANLTGALIGTLATAIALIEIFGLDGTYRIAAVINLLIAVLAALLGYQWAQTGRDHPTLDDPSVMSIEPLRRSGTVPRRVQLILFLTGLCCLGLEICWTRDFTIDLQTTIYAFAEILATYLIGTAIGTQLYRVATRRGQQIPLNRLLGLVFPAALLPVLLGDPRLGLSIGLPLISLLPFSMVLGAITPCLIDRHAKGDPVLAGSLYALNIAGGIIGPLIAAYILLPNLSIRWAMIVLALPLAALTLLEADAETKSARLDRLALAVGAMTLLVAVVVSRAYDDPAFYPKPVQVRRDVVASVVASGRGRDAMLMVNAIPITSKTIETQIMADLPMAVQGHAQHVLDICFGMGTTFRTLTFWGGHVTAVDLSAAVTRSFGFFYPDAGRILANPDHRIVVDDGRRFLTRTHQRFDVITIDPPPPIAAAGSSLLYSVQFYAIAKRRMTPNAILQQWVPATSGPTVQSIALALHRSFPYVQAYRGYHRRFGIHFIASMHPIPKLTPTDFVARLPARAAQSMLHWRKRGTTIDQIATRIIDSRISFRALLPKQGADIPALSDQRPFNEYFLLRRVGLYP
jgi:predicted membrane-bound spermidine synthase